MMRARTNVAKALMLPQKLVCSSATRPTAVDTESTSLHAVAMPRATFSSGGIFASSLRALLLQRRVMTASKRGGKLNYFQAQTRSALRLTRRQNQWECLTTTRPPRLRLIQWERLEILCLLLAMCRGQWLLHSSAR